MAGVLPLLTQAWNTQLGATQSYVCDWAQAIVCTLTVVKPLPCQKQGCERTVHHLLDYWLDFPAMQEGSGGEQ
jgi:hypothetical protein